MCSLASGCRQHEVATKGAQTSISGIAEWRVRGRAWWGVGCDRQRQRQRQRWYWYSLFFCFLFFYSITNANANIGTDSFMFYFLIFLCFVLWPPSARTSILLYFFVFFLIFFRFFCTFVYPVCFCFMFCLYSIGTKRRHFGLFLYFLVFFLYFFVFFLYLLFCWFCIFVWSLRCVSLSLSFSSGTDNGWSMTIMCYKFKLICNRIHEIQQILLLIIK